MKAHLQQTDDALATRAAKAKLNTIVDQRNQIAHPKSDTSFPDIDQVLDTAAFLSVLGEKMTEIVRVYTGGFRGGCEASA